MINIDEIYELFAWDGSLAPEEYERRVRKGMELAQNVKYLFPFLQPFVPDKGKSIWEPCAKVLAERSDEELEPYLPFLLEWLQDLNWPGADIVLARLAAMPCKLTEEALSFARERAEKDRDEMWLHWLTEFEKLRSEKPTEPR